MTTVEDGFKKNNVADGGSTANREVPGHSETSAQRISLILPFYLKFGIVLLSLIALFYVAVLGKGVLAPMIFALLSAILLLPVAAWLETKMKFHRSLAALCAVLLLLSCTAAIGYIVALQISGLASNLPRLKLQILSTVKGLQNWITTTFQIEIIRQNSYMTNTASQLLTSGPSIVGATLRSVMSNLIFFLFVMIDTFFLLYYRKLLVKFLVAVFREENSKTVYAIIAQVQSRIRQYVRGLLFEMIIVSTVCCVALWILGIKYFILLGLLTGLLNLLPYIGIFISLLLSIIVTVATAGAGHVLLLIATLFGIHLLDANLLLPLIVGAKVRLNALITILGVIVGASIWGITGAFLAIPVIAITKIVCERIDGLKPWSILLGDERDEKRPGPLTIAIKKNQQIKPASP
jgi:putative permease